MTFFENLFSYLITSVLGSRQYRVSSQQKYDHGLNSCHCLVDKSTTGLTVARVSSLLGILRGHCVFLTKSKWLYSKCQHLLRSLFVSGNRLTGTSTLAGAVTVVGRGSSDKIPSELVCGWFFFLMPGNKHVLIICLPTELH